MKVVIGNNLEIFKLILNIMSKVGLETNMVFTDSGLTMIASHAGDAALKTTLKKEFFQEYSITGEKEEIGIQLNELKNMLKVMKN
ncbi:hypothetical protein LCGC14_3146470, partial [marine sediment metagenome]